MVSDYDDHVLLHLEALEVSRRETCLHEWKHVFFLTYEHCFKVSVTKCALTDKNKKMETFVSK